MSLLGKFAYEVYYRPAGQLKLLRQRGLIDSTLAHIGQKRLHQVAQNHLHHPVAPVNSCYQPPDAPVVAYLGGDRNVDLLYASLCSLYVHWVNPPRVLLISDGHLSRSVGSALAQIFPGLQPIYEEELVANLEAQFPRTKFPALRSLRDDFLLARKLLDVYTLTPNWVMFVDADTAFLQQPDVLKDWFVAPDSPFFLLDRKNSYTYPFEVMGDLTKTPILEQVNTGLVSLKGSLIDWQRLEYWYTQLSQDFARNHFVEQSLIAMILSTLQAKPLPADYICEPTKQQVTSATGSFHHYVWPCRHFFYARGWQNPTRQFRSPEHSDHVAKENQP